MKKVNCLLLGFGNVGRSFYRLVTDKYEDLQARYGLDVRLAGVFRSEAGCVFSPPVPFGDLEGDPDWNEKAEPGNVLGGNRPGILVECLSSDPVSGEPGLDFMERSIEAGWHVVSADKAPLIRDLKRLEAFAAGKGVRLGISGATAAALPALDIALHSLAGARILAFEGVLNGTSNHILTRMGEGLDFTRALAEAQDMGVAEPDPGFDVEGWDTAGKVLLLSREIWSEELDLRDIDVKGIDTLTKGVLGEARSRGQALKLLGKAASTPEGIRAAVVPMAVGPDHQLFGVRGVEKGITFWTDTMGAVTVIGGKSDPVGAAAALLKDLINIFR